MSAPATRRSTRRTGATATSNESAQSASEQGTPPPEAPKKKGRKAKAPPTKAEPQTVTESQQTAPKTRGASRVNAASASTTTTTSTKTSSTVVTKAAAIPRRATRASRAALEEAGGQASPQRSLEDTRPAKRPRSAAPTKNTGGKRRLLDPESAPKSITNGQEDEDDVGPFFTQEFNSEIFSATESSPAQAVFTNGNESALALLHKIEKSAKETMRVEPSSDKSETQSETNVNKEVPQPQSVKRTLTEVSATPDRPVEKSNIFSRSFSAIKSRLFSSTPKPPPTPEVASPTPTKPLPPPDTLTETLSLPPTPVGERVKTPSKRRTPSNTMLKVLLKGIDHEDKRKAENWARQVIPELRNDPTFREKRKRLETPVLFKDLNFFPSSKPWETGFGDPLGDLDDDDVVPAWAVYLDMKAEEEEHTAKRRKKFNASATEEEVPTLDEQFAASNGARIPQKFYNSHGHSASLFDLRPRRSIDPSPMFSNSVSHSEGGNIFSELQGHDTAAKIRENDREVLKSATKETVDTQTQSSVGSSFSVPDDSDDDESAADVETANTETLGTEAAPIWTQPPPPAPVPAHAPLPGGSTADAPLSPPSQQPVDEIERQRQRLMKHTPAKPSRLREATYPSPSVLSDVGNESLLAATPAPIAASVASMFDDIPVAEAIELDAEEQAALEELINSEEYKQQLAAEWPPAILTYESDEEELSPSSH